MFLLPNPPTAAFFRSNANIADIDCSDISGWADADTGTGASTQITFDGESTFKFDSGGTIGGQASRNIDVGTFGVRYTATFRVYCDTIGTLANQDFMQGRVDTGDQRLLFNLSSDGLSISDGAVANEVGTDLVIQDQWQEWTFDVDNATPASATCDVYRDGALVASSFDCSFDSGVTDGRVSLTQNSVTTANQLSYVDFIKLGDDLVEI
jgi:hypothetical protein